MKKRAKRALIMKSTGILRKVDVRILLVANGFRAVLERSSCSTFAAESCAMHYMTDCSVV